MKRTLVGGTLAALIILGSPALATTEDQQPAVGDNTLESGEHSKIWVKVDNTPAQEISEVKKQQPATENLKKKPANAESTIQSLKHQLAASREEAAQQAENLQKKLTEAESTVHRLEEKAKESAQTIENLNQQLTQIQSLTEQPLTITECDALRAQVTGLEIITQEQQQTIDKNLEEQNSWKINKDLLLSNIRELQNKLKMLEENTRGLMRDLAAAQK